MNADFYLAISAVILGLLCCLLVLAEQIGLAGLCGVGAILIAEASYSLAKERQGRK
jgi:hypothetical protein